MVSQRSLLSLAAVASAAAFMPATFVRNSVKTALNDRPEGWVGGFPESNPDFAYAPPAPDLSSLPVLGNLDNIDKLQRQQKVLWPQFSWLTNLGDPASRCYQMFAPDISRLGYTNEGRIYSIICPQQGFGTNTLGNLNVEVTVTGQRGWCDEPAQTLAADMSVIGQFWFSEGTEQNRILYLLAKCLNKLGHNKMPFSKENSIKVYTHQKGKPYQPLFALLNGTNTDFAIPQFARHWDEAYGVAHLEVEIGAIMDEPDTNEIVRDFNQLVLDTFNLGSGNILAEGQILSWNVWFAEPELVDQEEWANHAEVWRKSLEVTHHSPHGDGVSAKFYDGTDFSPLKTMLPQEIKLLKAFIKKHIADPETGKILPGLAKKLLEAEIDEFEKLLQQFFKYSKYSDSF